MAAVQPRSYPSCMIVGNLGPGSDLPRDTLSIVINGLGLLTGHFSQEQR